MTEGRLAPEEVRTRTFSRVVRGYKRREVRRLLERAATDLARLRNGLGTERSGRPAAPHPRGGRGGAVPAGPRRLRDGRGRPVPRRGRGRARTGRPRAPAPPRPCPPHPAPACSPPPTGSAPPTPPRSGRSRWPRRPGPSSPPIPTSTAGQARRPSPSPARSRRWSCGRPRPPGRSHPLHPRPAAGPLPAAQPPPPAEPLPPANPPARWAAPRSAAGRAGRGVLPAALGPAVGGARASAAPTAAGPAAPDPVAGAAADPVGGGDAELRPGRPRLPAGPRRPVPGQGGPRPGRPRRGHHEPVGRAAPALPARPPRLRHQRGRRLPGPPGRPVPRTGPGRPGGDPPQAPGAAPTAPDQAQASRSTTTTGSEVGLAAPPWRSTVMATCSFPVTGPSSSLVTRPSPATSTSPAGRGPDRLTTQSW